MYHKRRRRGQPAADPHAGWFSDRFDESINFVLVSPRKYFEKNRRGGRVFRTITSREIFRKLEPRPLFSINCLLYTYKETSRNGPGLVEAIHRCSTVSRYTIIPSYGGGGRGSCKKGFI